MIIGVDPHKSSHTATAVAPATNTRRSGLCGCRPRARGTDGCGAGRSSSRSAAGRWRPLTRPRSTKPDRHQRRTAVGRRRRRAQSPQLAGTPPRSPVQGRSPTSAPTDPPPRRARQQSSLRIALRPKSTSTRSSTCATVRDREAPPRQRRSRCGAVTWRFAAGGPTISRWPVTFCPGDSTWRGAEPLTGPACVLIHQSVRGAP
jgi:hypothetical protein